ncbi:MAG: hypothetical protein VR64_00015 [Desulfatitalea sp. BRH_c12]|nr:MAG: hypothetical protein VR64_00015 [Desulfatitalea sp. BRH_c12]
MRWKSYPKYKDSGVAWLREVPEKWDALPLRRVVKTVKTGGTPLGAEEQFFDNDGFNWFTPIDFSEDLYLKESTRKLSNIGKDDVRCFPGKTVMMVGIGATIGKVGLSINESSCNQQVNGIVCGVKLTPAFCAYYLNTMRDFIFNCGKFTTLPIINQDETKSLIITIPSKNEQAAIADFLDRETGHLDTLIAKKQALIGLLKEKRTALISQTVTRGLPADSAREFGLEPHTRFRDSGIEWLGEVPEAWEVQSTRRYLLNHKQGYYSSAPYVDEGIKLLRISDFVGDGRMSTSQCPRVEACEELAQYLLREGDFVFARTGGAGSFAMIKELNESLAFAAYLIRFRFERAKVDLPFLRYFFLSASFQFGITRSIHGGVNQNVHAEDIKNQFCSIPPLPEQTAIATYLDRETTKIDDLITKIQAAIERLQEYRTALITAAVTGKIDVRTAIAKKEAA